MQPDSEDEAWRAIIDNYGERPDVDPADPPSPPEELAYADVGDRGPGDEDRFVPPPPPPVPRATPDRFVAWFGLFGAPTLLLVSVVTGLALPSWLGYLLVAWFVGGFAYLVSRMPSGPRMPGDDGARL